jgi:hypothetical protein
MKFLLGLALAAFCVGCYTTYVDVSLQTGAWILRGSWSGTASIYCDTSVLNTAWNTDNSRLATAGANSLRIWDTATGNEVGQVAVGGYQIQNLAFDGAELLIQRNSGTGALLERYSSAGVLQSSFDTGVSVPALSRDLSRIAGLSGKVLRVWDTQTKAVLHEHTLSQLEPNYGSDLTLNQDGTRAAIVVNGQQRQVLVVDVATGQVILRKTQPQNQYWVGGNLVFRSSALLVLLTEYSGNSVSNSIQQWDLPSGIVRTVLADRGGFTISPDGLYLVAKSPNFRVLDLQTKQEVVSNPRQLGSYSPDFQRGLLTFSDSSACGQQLVDIAPNTLQTKLVFDSKQDQSATLSLTPSYQSQSSYTVAGTLKLGSRNLRVEGVVYAVCVPGRNGETVCERFQARLAPLPQPFLRLFEDTKEVGVIRFYGGLKADRSFEGDLVISDKGYRINLTPQ